DAPDPLAVGEIERVELPFGAECVDAILRDDRNGARPFVEAEIVAVGGRIRKPPQRVAASCVERLDHLFVADAMKQDQAIAGHARPGNPLSARLAQDALRSASRPRRRQPRPGVDAVALGTKKLGPVVCEYGHAGQEKAEHARSTHAETVHFFEPRYHDGAARVLL